MWFPAGSIRSSALSPTRTWTTRTVVKLGGRELGGQAWRTKPRARRTLQHAKLARHATTIPKSTVTYSCSLTYNCTTTTTTATVRYNADGDVGWGLAPAPRLRQLQHQQQQQRLPTATVRSHRWWWGAIGGALARRTAPPAAGTAAALSSASISTADPARST